MDQPILTEHMTRDLPAQDQAMETFRTMSKFPVRSFWVSRDGNTMNVRILDRKRADEYVKVARMVILAFDLPLQEELDEFRMGKVVIGSTLILKYTAK